MYRIEYDLITNCLAIHVAGFWQPEDVPAFSDALDVECRRARVASPVFKAVIHSGDFPVQANDVADLLTGVMVRTIGLTEGHVAVIVGSLLNKMQVERTLVHPRVRPFMTAEEAQPWLDASPQVPAGRRAVG